MLKRFTTSAQKSLKLPKIEILEKLDNALRRDNGYRFEVKKSADTRQANLPDGSKLVIAAFDKEDGTTLAMIDFQDLPAHLDRATIQNGLRQKLDQLFS